MINKLFKKYYRTHSEANHALANWDDIYFENDPDLIYIAVKKSKNPFYNYQLEFGRKSYENKTGKISNEEKGFLPIKIPRFLSLEEVENNTSKKKEIRTRAVWTSFVSEIEKDQSNNFAYDPIIQGGRSVSNEPFKMGGTLGAIFKLKKLKGYYGISNRHVLQDRDNILDDRDIIYNPRVYDIPFSVKLEESRSGILVWQQFTPFLDAAIYRIEDENRIKTKLKNGHKLLGINQDPKLNSGVLKCGYKTNTKSGKIRSINTTVRAEIRGVKEIFKRQLQISKISESGDSGSLVYDNAFKVVGLLFADNKKQDEGFSYANNINLIFNHEFEEPQAWRDYGDHTRIQKIELEIFV